MSNQECKNYLMFTFRFWEKKSQETFPNFECFNIHSVTGFIITNAVNITICSSWEKDGPKTHCKHRLLNDSIVIQVLGSAGLTNSEIYKMSNYYRWN